MNPIPLDKLIEMWQTDATIDRTEPSKEIAKIPNLHAKYIAQISAHSLALKLCNIEYYKLRKVKVDYFNGRFDQAQLDHYGWPQFKYVMQAKSDLGVYLDADDDLNKYVARKALHEEAMNLCTAIIKELNNRTWQLKEYMSWERFIAGS